MAILNRSFILIIFVVYFISYSRRPICNQAMAFGK